jgi:DnaJ-class molecular chaperone
MPKSVCDMCGGSKYVSAETIEQCNTCVGTGNIISNGATKKCPVCNGVGSKIYIRKLHVVPAVEQDMYLINFRI